MEDELDQTISMEPDDEEVTFPRNSDHKPKPLYHNFQGFVDDLNAWSVDTFQAFVKGPGSEKIPSNQRFAAIVYRKIKFVCIHHGQYSTGAKDFVHLLILDKRDTLHMLAGVAV